MTRSPLLCCTSIIRSSPLVQASSSLSMICACAWPTEAIRQRNPFPPFSREFLSDIICWCVISLSAILVLCELYDFALLELLTTYPITIFFSLLSFLISAFTNSFWLYFDAYIKCLDSSSLHRLWAQGLHYGFLWRSLYIQVDLWTWVIPSSTCSNCMRSHRLYFAGSNIHLNGHSIHISFCFVIICWIRSPILTGKPFDCCSCTTYILQDDSLHGSRQALNGHLLMTSLFYFGSLHISEGSP